MRSAIGSAMVEASSDRRKTTIPVRAVIWAPREATVDFSEGERGAMQASDYDLL